MKGSNIIWIGISVAALAALGVYVYMQRRRDTQLPYLVASQGTPVVTGTTANPININYNLQLGAGKSGAEVLILQKMLQAFDNSLSATGTFDANTQAVLKKVAGKSSTSLYEFRYTWFSPRYGEPAAKGLIQSVTGGLQ